MFDSQQVLDPNNQVTIIETIQLNSNLSLLSFFNKSHLDIYRFFLKDTTQEAILVAWIFKMIAFRLIWWAFILLINPISVVLDFSPMVNLISCFFNVYFTAVVAFGISFLIIISYHIAHNLFVIFMMIFFITSFISLGLSIKGWNHQPRDVLYLAPEQKY